MSEHYYTAEPTSKIAEKSYSYCLSNGRNLSFTSVSGVFAHSDSIDRASELLINSFVPESTTSSLLDFGCGYGPIGLCLKVLYPSIKIAMTDINKRATEYALKNASINKVDVTVQTGDMYENISNTFDCIVTNPPMAMGKQFIQSLIEQSFAHLNQGGTFWYTAYHNKGGEAIMKMCNSVFGNVKTVNRSGGIHIYKSTKI